MLFEYLEPWERLSIETRRLFLEKIGSDLQARPEDFTTEQLEELRSNGFLQLNSTFLFPELRPTKELFDSMYRHRHFDQDHLEPPVAYVKEHLTLNECQDTGGRCNRRISRDFQTLAEYASKKYWISSFFECTNYRQWQPYQFHDKTLNSEKELLLIQDWLRQLIDGTNPQPMLHLLKAANNNILHATDSFISAIRLLLLFPALDKETLLPVVGVSPAVYAQWHKEPIARPKSGPLPDECEIYHAPLLLRDLNSLLITTSLEGLRLKKNSTQLFKKELRRVEENMPLLPDWIQYPANTEQRCNHALHWLTHLKYASAKSDRLTITAAGKRWLAESEFKRLNTLHDALLKMRQQTIRGHYLSSGKLAYLPNNPQQYVRADTINLEDIIEETFADLPIGEWVDLVTYLYWCSESKNPFKTGGKKKEDTQLWEYYQYDDEYREKSWQPFLIAFLLYRLLALGGAQMARDPDGKYLFSVTPTGAYLLGKTDVFTYKEKKTDASIIIQPDFEVIFTAQNIHAETVLMRFSERKGQGAGALFKITRKSVLSALHSKITGEQIVESIKTISSTPPPQNVLQQILDWGHAFRKVEIKQIWTINCPDKETAARIVALLPRDAAFITETRVEINPASKDMARIKKKLKDNSIGFN